MKKYALLIVLISLVDYGLMCRGKRKMSDLALANVEALAQSESGGVDCCNNDCNGDFCGTFYPANGSGVGVSMYYK